MPNANLLLVKRAWGLSKKGKKQQDFWELSPKKTQPGPDGRNASG